MTNALFAAAITLVVTIVIGHPIVRELRRRKMGKAADLDAPEAYHAKAGTPVMGGLMILAAIIVVGVPFAVASDSRLLLPLGVMLVMAAFGAYDDLQTLEIAQKLSGHEIWFWATKWGVLIALGVVVAAVLYFSFDLHHIVVPHFGAYSLGVLYLPLVVAVFVAGTSGMVITDGMDGLMAGVTSIAYAAFGVIALMQGQDELGAFALIVAAATAGFLWFNANPASVFMGEIGVQSLAVGLIVVAFMTGWWLLLPVIGIVYFAEGFSDVIQIGYYKRSGGKRFFRMAPIHYHFQLGGWTETQVVTRFWLAGLAAAFLGVALARVE